jgi:hypothetical protein
MTVVLEESLFRGLALSRQVAILEEMKTPPTVSWVGLHE